MKFTQTLIKGKLIKRYKRFLADIELDDGSFITAHTPNTGSMMGCCEAGSPVWISKSANEKRKYPLSWELIEVEPGVIVGINTQLPNKLVKEAIEKVDVNLKTDVHVTFDPMWSPDLIKDEEIKEVGAKKMKGARSRPIK